MNDRFGVDLADAPHSVEAEQSVLGGLLLDNSAWDHAGVLLTETDFYRYQNQHIYAAIGGLIAAGKPADPITVFDQLQALGKAEACGGVPYLNDLTQSVMSAANLKAYAEIVRECAARRAVIAVSDRLAWDMRDPRDRSVAQLLQKHVAKLADLTPTARDSAVDIDQLFAQCHITEDFVKHLEETRFVWKHVIAAAHIGVWASPAGSGKTTVARRAAKDMARGGMKVLYFMEDAGASDFKLLQRHAQDSGYTLINSTAGNKTPDDIFELIRSLSRSGSRLEGYVLILDTLKKFLDVMGKAGARDFFKVLRAITMLGGTVLLLAHTNKHKDVSSGKPVFEGVGDIRNDVDELFYIEAVDDVPGGDRLATISLDKYRCMAEACSFRLVRSTLEAEDAPLTDVAAIAAAVAREKADSHVIAAVEVVLKARGGESQERLVAEVAKSVGIGIAKVRAVVRDYSDTEIGERALWNVTRGLRNNENRVSWPPGRQK